jgi:hypothetical protein
MGEKRARDKERGYLSKGGRLRERGKAVAFRALRRERVDRPMRKTNDRQFSQITKKKNSS